MVRIDIVNATHDMIVYKGNNLSSLQFKGYVGDPEISYLNRVSLFVEFEEEDFIKTNRRRESVFYETPYDIDIQWKEKDLKICWQNYISVNFCPERSCGFVLNGERQDKESGIRLTFHKSEGLWKALPGMDIENDMLCEIYIREDKCL
ncbi:MAG TPA: hypothetical protein VHA52_10090 [Candidatus Babeliaceae bacterium]|nr:hypothetical protein [Candidatus Babeliaceae bacterium]